MVANGIVVASSAGNRRAACGDPASGNVNRIPTVAAATLGITVGNSVVGSLTISPSSFEFMPTVDRGDDEIFFDSLRGPRSDGREKPEVSAPGTAIESARHDTINNYTMRVGTSMSAPHVSGLASIILEEKPEINPGSLKDLLIRTAHRPADPLPDVQNPTWDADWGYGLVDGYQAIWQVTGQGEDQTDITFEGFAGQSHPPDPIWLSPAIRFNSGANEDVVLIGSPNDISVRVLNRDREANNVSVVIGIYYFAASDPDKPQFYEIASLAEDFPVGITDINHSWTPSRDLDIFADPEAHICLRVFIDYGLDSDFSNYSNVAQRNLRRVEISSPAVFKFRVENPLFEDATIHLDVRGEDKNPPGWKFELSDNDFEMDQFACERDIELIVTPPDDPSPGAQATYHVYASATTEKGKNIPLGGLSAQAYVPEKPGLPFVITAVIWAGIIVVIAIAIFFFTKKYRRKEG
jgi:hypothetical protein